MTAIRVPVTKTDPSPKFLAEQQWKIAERIARRDAKILERFIRRLNSWQPARCGSSQLMGIFTLQPGDLLAVRLVEGSAQLPEVSRASHFS
jgi:hypothetical protein